MPCNGRRSGSSGMVRYAHHVKLCQPLPIEGERQVKALSNLTICYEALQRVHRNAVVRYVRRKILAVDPRDYSERIKKPFEKEWDKLTAWHLERPELD